MQGFRLVKHNGHEYVVSLRDRWLHGNNLPPVFPLLFASHFNPPQPRLVNAVRFDEYVVTDSSDPKWRAFITLTGEQAMFELTNIKTTDTVIETPRQMVIDGKTIAYVQTTTTTSIQDSSQAKIGARTTPRIRVAEVRILMGEQVSTTLPLDKILKACIQVGLVVGYILPDNRIELELTDTGQLITPDELAELTGMQGRLPAKEQHETALDAAKEFVEMTRDGYAPLDPLTGDYHSIYTYVAERTGIADGHSLLTAARKNPLLQDLAKFSYLRKAKK